jgi:hypothetical protein
VLCNYWFVFLLIVPELCHENCSFILWNLVLKFWRLDYVSRFIIGSWNLGLEHLDTKISMSCFCLWALNLHLCPPAHIFSLLSSFIPFPFCLLIFSCRKLVDLFPVKKN